MGAYSDRVIADGATNYWRLGETVGTTAVDVVGGANGTISGGVTLNQPGATSDGNRAMSFNGTSGMIATAANVAIPLICTVEMWLKPPDVIAQRPLLAVIGGQVCFHLNGTLRFYDGPNGVSTVSSTISLVPNVWQQVVYVVTGTAVTTYVNSVLIETFAVVRTIPGLGLANLGRDATFADARGFWSGLMDEVAIYPRALTAGEIAAHYALATAGTSNSFPFAYRIQPGGAAVDSFNLWEPITPSNTVDLPRGVSGGIWVGGGGDVAAVMGNNVMPIVFAAVPTGAWLPIAAKRINATGTTATGLVGLYEV